MPSTDADTLDGQHGWYYQNWSNLTGTTNLRTYLNADLLDSQHGAYYQNIANSTGNMSPYVKLNGVYPVAIKTGNCTLLLSEATVIFVAPLCTATLPGASACVGKVYHVKQYGVSGLVLNGASGQLIDGSSSFSFVGNQCLTVQSDGSDWHCISVYP